MPNPMQKMLMQAQKLQREMLKAQEELAAKEFTSSAGGIVNVTIKGSREITSIKIDEEALKEAGSEIIEESLISAINTALRKIQEANDQIEEKLTHGNGGLPF